MKLKEYLLRESEKNLIGMMVDKKLITDKTKNETWHGNFNCGNMSLTSIIGVSRRIDGNFNCGYNKLKSLEGSPEAINGNFYCSHNMLPSLKDIHKHIKEIKGTFYADDNPIRSHVLGLLLIKGIADVKLDRDSREAEKIINKYLPNTKGQATVDDCKSELIKAGLEKFAQL